MQPPTENIRKRGVFGRKSFQSLPRVLLFVPQALPGGKYQVGIYGVCSEETDWGSIWGEYVCLFCLYFNLFKQNNY